MSDFIATRSTHTVEESMIWRNGRNNGIHQERERIIKLLEDDFWHHRIIIDEKPTCLASCDMCKLIALIKGENQ